MNAKEIKSALKEARENIKNKDFKSALKLCKNVLKADRNNYVGLVLFGVSLQDTDQKDQAPNAFKRAIEVSPNQILAWQGLASYYEKDSSEASKKELIDVYGQLLVQESDLNKFSEICSKLTAVAVDVNEYEKCINILEQQESLSDHEQKQVIWKTIVSLLEQNKEMTPKLYEALETSLGKIIDEEIADNMLEQFKKYLKLLYKNKKLLTLVDKARKMNKLYPKCEYPLEWICRAYSELITVSAEVGEDLAIDIDVYCDKLASINPSSSMIILAKGAKLYKEGLYDEACDALKQVINILPKSPYLWALLCQSYANMYCHIDAEHCATEALNLLKKQSNPDMHLQSMLNILLVRSLSCQTAPQKVATAIEKCKEILQVERGNLDILTCLARAYIADDNLVAAQKCISVLEEEESHHATAVLLNALILKKEGLADQVLDILSEAVNDFPHVAEVWLELGKAQWEAESFDSARVSFLKAATLNQNCYTCFVYLGRYYSLGNKDLNKARRCYQKAFNLNSRSEEAGAGLSDIYRLQNCTELNVDLLSYVTQEAGPGGAKWAWLRLGLHHLEKGNISEAITCLRATVRGDPTDCNGWESLGDAYLARGSYTSALKSYEKVLEESPGALYASHQVASLKLLIGHFQEALGEFKSIVAENPKYVPALKGLGETYLALARAALARRALDRCGCYCRDAFDAFTAAADKHRNLSCLWKLLGDTCTTMAKLPHLWAYLDVERWMIRTPEQADEDNGDKEHLNKEQVLQLGARCYCRALSVSPKSSLLWHDLALNYHFQATQASSPHTRKQLRENAFTAAKKSVTLNPRNWKHWNLLGVVAVTKEINNYRLAQHGFIKALKLESLNPLAWTNLGAIYLIYGKKRMANQAFKMAQTLEPSYMQCWIGQALIAESIDHEETMDLFRHAASLGFHPESALGYAQWVCSTILEGKDKTDPLYVYSIEKLHAVPVASDSIMWYTSCNPDNACAFNILGILMERQRLYNTAGVAFGQGVAVLEGVKGDNVSNLRDKLYCNLGRVLVQLNRHEEAIQAYLQIKEASFVSSCGLAVAYFKAEMYEESYETYESILHWFASDDGMKSHIYVAMAAMAYKFEKVEEAKTLLLKSVQLKPPSVPGLLALCSYGFLHGELHTSEAVLQELVLYEQDPKYLTHIAVFKAYAHFLKGHHKEAVRSLAKATFKHPAQGSLWLNLALLQLNLYPEFSASSAAACALRAMGLGQHNMDVSKILSLVSLGHLFSGRALPGLSYAKKSVHLFPDLPENWVILIACFLPWCMIHKSLIGVQLLKSTIGYVRRKMETTRQMAKWLSHHEHKVDMLSEEYS